MSSLFVPTIHPRVTERQQAGPPKIADAIPKTGFLAKTNARFGLGITVAVGSMWAAYLFTLLALISLPSALRSGSLIIIISWIAQTFLQLVLLPIIIVGQNVMGPLPTGGLKRHSTTLKPCCTSISSSRPTCTPRTRQLSPSSTISASPCQRQVRSSRSRDIRPLC